MPETEEVITMNDLLHATMWVVGLFSLVSALLYVLAILDPQTERAGELTPGQLSPARVPVDA